MVREIVALLRHDRSLVFAAVGLLTVLAWGYLAGMTIGMAQHMDLGRLGPGMAVLESLAQGFGLAPEHNARLGDCTDYQARRSCM